MKTIFAQSSRPGKAGVALFRISGPNSMSALKQLLINDEAKIIPKIIYYKKIYDPRSKELIDHAMVVYFKSPASFTGEDVVELYTHGSVAIAKMLHLALLNIEGLRLAEPGEFARRAFLNGKFDLTSAEGLADLIEAETMWQHKQAIKQMDGGLAKLYDQWREQLLTTISLLEAYIDFPDEEIPDEVLTRVLNIIAQLKSAISNHLDDNRRGELLRNGLRLIILGAPNVGKSSLLNFLLQRDVAIVSDIAGTTRDIIEGHLDIGGYPLIVQDTAGIRLKSNDLIEQQGINRAIKAAQSANIKIIMIDASKPDYCGIESLIDDKTILVINKIDLNDDYEDQVTKYQESIRISLKDNVGLDLLLKKIENISNNIAGNVDFPQITRERHRHQLEQALKYLANARIPEDLLLATEDIRMAIRSLSCITGKITVEEIIGKIFSSFCIGK